MRAASSNRHGSVGGLPQATRQGGCAPSILRSGVGQAAVGLPCRRHPATAEEERCNSAGDPNGGSGVAAVSGIWGPWRCPLEIGW